MSTVRGQRIACVHLYDDFSGSAKVFAQAIHELKAGGADVRVTVGSAGKSGFIRSSHPAQTVFYRFFDNTLALLASFAIAQTLLFFNVLRSCLVWKADVVYANTILAPGAVLAGRLCRRRVVVHLHEVGLGAAGLFNALLRLTRAASDRVICVSEYMRNVLELPHDKTAVIHNCLSGEEWAAARAIAAARVSAPDGPFVVLMACSLKWYKGLDSFFLLARRFLNGNTHAAASVRFSLVLNCTPDEWTRFASGHEVPANVTVTLRPQRILEHYGAASLVLNLSHRERWIETFGMTLLEAMACGTPVIGPTVGGCLELFRDGYGGWHIDSRDIDALAERTTALAANGPAWQSASRAARDAAASFDPQTFPRRLLEAVSSATTFRSELPSRA